MRIAEELIKDKNREPVSVPSSTSIKDAVALMVRENVGCLLVSEGESIVGIWTERDLARNFAKQGFDIATSSIGSVMSQPLEYCEWTDSVYSLIDTILGRRIRHLPVRKDGVFIGLISAGDVMKSVIQAKDSELAQANSTLSWHYYEEWKHK